MGNNNTLFMHVYTIPSENLIRNYFNDEQTSIGDLINKILEMKKDTFLPITFQEISAITVLKVTDAMKTFSYLLTRAEGESELDLMEKLLEKIKNRSIDLKSSNKITVNGFNYLFPMINIALERNRIKSTELSGANLNYSYELKLKAPFREYAYSVGLCKYYDMDMDKAFINIDISYLRRLMLMDSYIIAKLYFLQLYRKTTWIDDFEKVNEYLNIQFTKNMEFLLTHNE